MIVRVLKNGVQYSCQAQKGNKFKCGACQLGIVYPVQGDICMECMAVVAVVVEKLQPSLRKRRLV